MDDDLRAVLARIKFAENILKVGTRLTPIGLRQRYLLGTADVDLLMDGLFIEEGSVEDAQFYVDFFDSNRGDAYAFAMAMAATVVLDLGK